MKNQQFKIGDCILDNHNMSLSRGDASLKLSEKVFLLLNLFLSSQDSIVSRANAIEVIWLGNEAVGDRGFTNGVWTLRKAFKDLGIKNDDIFITLPKLGYQLTLPITPIKNNKFINFNNKKFFLYCVGICLILTFILGLINYTNSAVTGVNDIKTSLMIKSRSKETNYEGIEEHPAISNNGRYMAFQWTRESFKGKIYVKDLQNNSIPLNLLSMSSEEEASPAWSFNDESIAYVRLSEDGKCQVRIRHLVTNNDEFIDDDCFYLPYRRVLAWTNNDDTALIYSKHIDNKVALFSYDFATKKIEQKTFPSANEIDYAPHYLDNNSTIAFARKNGSQLSNLLIKTVDGSHPLTYVLKNKVGIVDLDWNKEQNSIFVNYAENGKFNIKQLMLDSNEEILISDRGLPSNLSFNHSLSKLTFANHISKEYIAQISLKTGKTIRRISSSSRDMYGRYIPKTDSILFLSNRSNTWDVWLNNKINSVNLSESLGNATVPAISPDGSTYAVSIRSDDKQKNHLYLGSLAQSTLTEIDTQGLFADNLTWSNNGKKLYFHANKGNSSGLYSLTLANSEIKPVSLDSETYAVEDTDGNLYVTKANKNGLWKLNPNTLESTLVTDELSSYDYGAFYLQDGDLYYLHRDKSADQLKRINKHGKTDIVFTSPANSVRKYFGISKGDQNSFIATLKLTNESDIKALIIAP